MIVQRYTGPIEAGNPGSILNYQALHDDVSEIQGAIADSKVPTSPFFPPEEFRQWSANSVGVVQRVTAAAVEKRLRMKDYFEDFDPLRKGFCTPTQALTVFGILKLEMNQSGMGELCGIYCDERGLFNYAQFAFDVDQAFCKDGLEQEPLTRICVPDANATLPARKSQMLLDLDVTRRIDELEEEIRVRIRERRMLLIPVFEDFDPIHRGHVTKSQFARVMFTMGFRLDENDIDRLSRRYCDKGNSREFNYKDFMRSVDQRDPREIKAAKQVLEPYHPHRASQYYDYAGHICPKVN